MEVNDPKFQKLCELLEDYSDFLWKEPELRNALMFFVGRFIETGQDISDEELAGFENSFKIKIEKMVKEKAN